MRPGSAPPVHRSKPSAVELPAVHVPAVQSAITPRNNADVHASVVARKSVLERLEPKLATSAERDTESDKAEGAYRTSYPRIEPKTKLRFNRQGVKTLRLI